MASLYIHVPFCRQKCPYCDFFSVAGATTLFPSYPDLLCRHLDLAARCGWQGPFETIFFGGGTPSLLPPEAIARVLDRAAVRFGIAAAAEISLEANPGTVTLESLTGYRAAGINRLSLGVQSLDAVNLRRLGRVHDPAAARAAVAAGRQAGFANLSCDLMFALPGQSGADLLAEIDAFLALEAEHLACYGLTVEEGTPFAAELSAGRLQLPGEDEYAAFYETIATRLMKAGYCHYEISNYARPGRACRHNLRYWQRRGYLGIGAGAHSFCSRSFGERLAVPPDLPRYQGSLLRGEDPAVSLEIFARADAMAETLYLGLRTATGVSDREFRARFGLGVAEAFPAAITRAGEHLRLEDGHWRFDRTGWLLYDFFIASFL